MTAAAGRRWRLAAAMATIGLAGCAVGGPAPSASPSLLTIGYGLTTGLNSIGGVQQVVRNIALEGLVSFARDGRPQPWLAESLTDSDDHLTWTIKLRPAVTFHDRSALTAAAVRSVLIEQLPRYMGPAFEDVKGIVAVSADTIAITMKRRSNFVLEALDVFIQAPGTALVGTGPFAASTGSGDEVEMAAYPNYYGGRSLIDRIVIKPYSSVRAAWAELLRNRVDMLYEVGVDASESLGPSTATRIFRFERPYAFLIILNTQRPPLRSPEFRRTLNRAIDRSQFVAEGLSGHGRIADRPVWPKHWAVSEDSPRFKYDPKVSAARVRPQFTCLISDFSHERLALLIQRQLQEIGVDMLIESAPIDQAIIRVQNGDFDAWFADAGQGPTFMRLSQFWHSQGPLNWGHYSDPRVDQALDVVRVAPDEASYRAGVAEFQEAIIDDPPAIFLAWSERARAVSTRFDVPVEAGRDILGTLRLWRPLNDDGTGRRN